MKTLFEAFQQFIKELKSIKDELKEEISNLNQEIFAKIKGLQEQVNTLQNIGDDFAKFKEEIRKDMQDMKNEFDSNIQQLKREFNEGRKKTAGQITKLEAPVHVEQEKDLELKNEDHAHQVEAQIHVQEEKELEDNSTELHSRAVEADTSKTELKPEEIQPLIVPSIPPKETNETPTKEEGK